MKRNALPSLLSIPLSEKTSEIRKDDEPQTTSQDESHRGKCDDGVTREIHQPLSLARLSLLDEEKARAALISAIEQVSLLIQNAILHVDLHPGNVIVDSAEKVYLLDFDRGHVYHGSRRKLKDRYLTRWQRAVRKHGLPTILTEMMQKELK